MSRSYVFRQLADSGQKQPAVQLILNETDKRQFGTLADVIHMRMDIGKGQFVHAIHLLSYPAPAVTGTSHGDLGSTISAVALAMDQRTAE